MNENEWYRIQAKQKKTADILIYEQIGQNYSGEGISAKRFVEDLQALDVETINLHINSPGGNVFDGNAIYNTLKSHKAKINVTIDGIAASIASVVAMAGNIVEMPENAMMMIHDPSGFVVGTGEDMAKMMAALERVKTGMVAAYHGKSRLDKEQIAQMMRAETWMTAQDAVGFGFADKITERVTIQVNVEALVKYRNVPKNLIAGISSPNPRQGIDTEKAIFDEWRRNPAIQNEFRDDFEAFKYFKLNEHRTKIISGRVIQ